MIIKGQQLSARNLNNAYISKTDTNAQSISSNLTINGGALTLKNSQITDNANTSYMRIDPQGNQVIIYDGVNNQRLDVFSSSGSESTYIQTINGTTSIGQIDVASAVDHLEINTNSDKPVYFGGQVNLNSTTQGEGISLKPNGTNAQGGGRVMFVENKNEAYGFSLGYNGDADNTILNWQNNSFNLAQHNNTTTGNVILNIPRDTAQVNIYGTLNTSGKATLSGGVGIYSSNALSFDTYGGGFNMTDTTWIRTTGSKSFYHNAGTMRTDGTLQVGSNGATLNAPASGTFSLHSGKFTVATGGAITATGPLQLNTSKGSGGGIAIDTVNIDTVNSAGNIAFRNLNQLRFGDQSGWDWNLWAGIKYDSTNLKLYIGGPASAQFSSNSSPATIDVAFTGVGKLGIGYDSPTKALDVNGDIRVLNNFYSPTAYNLLNDSGASQTVRAGALAITTTLTDTPPTNGLYVQGSAGIGTKTPARKLDVIGDFRVSGNIYSGVSTLNLYTDAGGALPIRAGSLAITSSYSNSAPTNGLYVQGNTGIGTTSPLGKLHIVDTTQEIYTGGDHLYLKYTGAGHYPYIGFLDSGGVRGGYFGYGNPGSYIQLQLENSNNFYIGGGSVGIGTTAPAFPLDVVGSVQASTQFISKSNGDVFQALGTGTGVKTFRWDNSNLRFWTNALEVMTLTSGGRVGIGQGSPAYALDVTGDINATGIIYSPASNAEAFRIGNDASLWDINVTNTMGVYGVSNTAVGGIKLGSTGPTLFGSGGSLAIGATNPWSTVVLDIAGDVRLRSGNAIYSGYNNAYMLKDYGNGNVVLNGAGNQLYLGYQNTTAVRLSSNLVGTNGTTPIANNDGTLFYQGQDTDTRYVNATGDTISGNMVITGTLNLTSANDVNASGNGILIIGSTNTYNMQFDGNEIQGFNNGAIGNISLNLNGGDVVLGSTTNMKFGLDTTIFANGHTAINFFGPDSSGAGMTVGAGGLTIVGGGESAQTVKNALISGGSTGGTETLYLTSDNTIQFLTGQNSAYDNSNSISMSTSSQLNINAPNQHLQFSEAGTQKWHVEATGGSLKIVQTGVSTAMEFQSDGDVLINGSYVDVHYKGSTWKSITTSGWYRIAQCLSGNARAYGRFMVMDTAAGRHELIDFTAGVAYNKPESVNIHMLGRVKYGSSETFGGIRILTATTYDAQYLEVYCASGCSVMQYNELYNQAWYGGWQTVDWTYTSSIPTGYTDNKLELQDGYFRNQNVLSGTVSPPSQGAYPGDIYVQY